MFSEDKRTTLALMLIFIVVITYMQWAFPSKTAPVVAPGTTAPSISANATMANNGQVASNPVAGQSSASAEIIQSAKAGYPTMAEVTAASKSLIRTRLFNATVSSLGARLSSFQTTNFKAQVNSDALYEMVHESENSPLPLGIETATWNDAKLTFVLERATGDVSVEDGVYVIKPAGNAEFTFTATIPDGRTLSKTLGIHDDTYLIDITASLSGATKDANQYLWLQWNHYATQSDLTQRIDPYQLAYFDDTERVQQVKPVSIVETVQAPVNGKWMAFGDKYFMAALVADNQQQSLRVSRTGDTYGISVRGDENKLHAQAYVGPKDYQRLKNTNLHLERTIDLGFFAFLAYPLMQLLRLFHEFLGNWGVSIVLLTLSIKTLFYPLTKASLYSMRGMQQIAPEMTALRERIKDPTELNKEIMALYKKKGVNPMGGCLPVVVQIPVFFGLYSALQHAIELRHAPFAFWIHDLSTPEYLNIVGFNTPFMIMLMGAIMFYQQYSTPAPGMDPAQRKTMLGVSLMFTGMFFVFPFPAGLALYMLCNTSISLVQQRAIKSERFPKPFRVTLLASVIIFSLAFAASRLG